ncbi:MAG TPA: hypothetical protein VN281_00375, partial [Verrucomicrobiae bacterium]|nr:hypothetical protein [Verrucomicrobiae bacterium]
MMISRTVAFCLAICLGAIASTAAGAPGQIGENAMAQISALGREKASRSAVHQKLDSHFVFRLKQNRHQIGDPVLANLKAPLEFQPDGRLLVDINARVSNDLLAEIRKAGGTIRSSVPRFNAIRATVSLDQLENLAARSDVKFIKRAAKGHRRVDSEGDTTHGAITARSTFGVNGTNVNVGILSDSVDYLSNLQSS